MKQENKEVMGEQTAVLFQELRHQLHLDSTQNVVSLMRSVCSLVPWNYGDQGMAAVLASKSPLFYLLPADLQREEGTKVHHLDELADAMFQDNTSSRFFRTEIDALRGVIIVLIGIQKSFSRFGWQPFDYTLRLELQQAMQENALSIE
jgi:hypothetical protein